MFFYRFTGMRRLGALSVLLLTVTCVARAHSRVTLAWNATSGSTIAGYRVYSGVASQTYTTLLDVGNVTTVTVSNLTPTTTYYFAVTAYDLAGLESAFSAEISYTVPSIPPPQVSLNLSFAQTGKARLTGSAPPGYIYDILVSADLLSWTILGSVVTDPTGLLQFTDPNGPTNTARYYRLHQTLP